MTKLAVLGDLHLAEKSPRYHHALDLTRWAIRDAVEQGARHFFFLGDIFEGAPTPGEYGEFIQILFEALSHGGYVGICRGNHEHYEAMCFFEGLHPMLQVAWDNVRVLDIADAEIRLIPYPTRYKPPYDGLDDDGSIAGSMRAAAGRISEWIAEATKDDRPLIIFGHFTIEGLTTRDTQFELHSTNEVVVPLASFTRPECPGKPEGPDLAVVGHIHRGQDLTPRVLAAGSLYRTSFAEAEDRKSYLLVTIEQDVAGRAAGVSYERRSVPAREMAVYELEWSDIVDRGRQILDLRPIQQIEALAPGREIKITVSMDAEEASQYDVALFDGIKAQAALLVIEKIVRPKQRTRAPQLTAAMSLGEELVAWLQATEQALVPERIARLVEKAESIV